MQYQILYGRRTIFYVSVRYRATTVPPSRCRRQGVAKLCHVADRQRLQSCRAPPSELPWTPQCGTTRPVVCAACASTTPGGRSQRGEHREPPLSAAAAVHEARMA